MALKVCGPKCSTCCSLLSLWGVVMLTLMAIFFRLNALAFVEDIGLPPSDQLNKTILENTYASVSNNCFIAAGLYVFFLLFSVCQFRVNKKLQYQVN